jgi:serine protease Do
MKNLLRLLFAVVFGVFSPMTSFGQSQESPLSGYRYAMVPLQTFSTGKVDPYGLGKELRRRIAADPSWQVLTDVEVTTKLGAGALWPAELSWQAVAKSDFIAQDRIKLAQTVSLSIHTPGGRGRIEVAIVVSDMLGRELARFEGVSGLFGNVTDRMLNGLDKAITALSQARPQFKPNLARTAATEKVAIDEAEVRSYLLATPKLSPIEGIWVDREGAFRIAITREQGTPRFRAVVLSSKHPFWDSGMVKARFEPTAEPTTLISHYRLDDHQEQTVTFRVERSSLVSTSTNDLGVRFVRLDTGEVRPAEPVPSVATLPVSPAPAAPAPVAPAKPQTGSLRRIGTGTAFVVGQNLIATNVHVIDGGTAWELRFPSADEALPLELVVADKANDLAMMRVRGAGSPLKPLSVVTARTARLGEDVYSVGFPLTGLLSDGHKVATGVVSGLAGLDNDPRFLQLTVPTQPGNSGGPIFNSKGEVVGILASTLSVDYLYKATRAIPQNVNFAIKSDYLLLLMDQANAGTALAQVSPSAVSRADQIANAQASIGLVSTFAAEEPRSRAQGAQPTVDASTAPKVPSLEIAYRHPNGANILIRQRGESATITFYRADASIYGNASVSWKADAGGFVGSAEIPYVCGSLDTRVTTIRSGLELFLEDAGTLRMRYQVPSGINCSRNRVDSFNWGEDRWYP